MPSLTELRAVIVCKKFLDEFAEDVISLSKNYFLIKIGMILNTSADMTSRNMLTYLIFCNVCSEDKVKREIQFYSQEAKEYIKKYEYLLKNSKDKKIKELVVK